MMSNQNKEKMESGEMEKKKNKIDANDMNLYKDNF
jgi:hypothetical protein